MNILKEYNQTELFSHILTEFRRIRFSEDYIMLTESHGYYEKTENVVSVIIDNLKDRVYKFCNSKNNAEVFIYSNDNFSDNPFEKIYVRVKLVKTDKKSYNAYLDMDKTFFHNEKGELDFKPFIVLNIASNTYNNFMYVLSFAIAHELTHAYNAYMFYKKKGVLMNYEYIEKMGYNRTILKNNQYYSDNEEAISNILHYIHRFERNAYIGQLKQELLLRKNEIKDSKSGYEALLKTNSYNDQFCYLERNIMAICHEYFTEEDKKIIVSAVNKFADKSFNNFEQTKKYLWNRWEKWRKAYMITASKIVCDVYSLNKRNITRDTNNHKNITVKNI